MSITRFEGLRLPNNFLYLDHPFIEHTLSDYVITVDDGVPGDDRHPGGWKVCLELGEHKPAGLLHDEPPLYRDVLYCRNIDEALTFVQMVTNKNPKLRFGFEVTKPRSAVWYDGR